MSASASGPTPSPSEGGEAESDAQAQEQIREVVQSKTELQQLPVKMDVRVSSTKTEARELALTAHLDPKSLYFRKDGPRNLNNVTFVFAIFDAKDNLLQVQQGQAKMDLSDAELQRSCVPASRWTRLLS